MTAHSDRETMELRSRSKGMLRDAQHARSARHTGGLLFMVMAMTAVSQFHRTSLGVIVPELARDIGASPEVLGLANAVFFAAFVVAQIPIGIALDRVGPRKLVFWLTGLAVAGSIGQMLARDGMEFVAARFVVGLGCSGSIMAAVVLCVRWFAGSRLTVALSRVFALSQIGIFLASSPMAWASALLGWRGALLAAAGVTVLVGLGWRVLVRDYPPDSAPPDPNDRESLREALIGQFTVWKTPGLLPILSMHVFGYAATATVMGLWAGAFLHDVYGLDSEARGWVLLAMGLALPSGLLVIGPLEQRLNTRKWLVVGGASGSIAVLAALAAIPNAPLWLAIGLLVTLCLLASYPVVVVAHGRTLFPDNMVGRGVTTVNLAQVLGAALLPAITGLVVGAVGENDPLAYRLAFATLAAALVCGVSVYLLSKDAPPRPRG